MNFIFEVELSIFFRKKTYIDELVEQYKNGHSLNVLLTDHEVELFNLFMELKMSVIMKKDKDVLDKFFDVENLRGSVKDLKLNLSGKFYKIFCQRIGIESSKDKNSSKDVSEEILRVIGSDITKFHEENIDVSPEQFSPNKNLKASDKLLKLNIHDEKEIRIGENKMEEGGQGVVHKGRYKGAEVAVKIINNYNKNETLVKYFYRQCNIMAEFSCPYITKVLGYTTEPNLIIVMEYVKKGNLMQYLRKKKACAWEKLSLIILGILMGIKELHSNNILHRDLKPSNILIADDYISKLADFGIAKAEDSSDSKSSSPGTKQYMAPEVLKCSEYSKEADIWSLGVILSEIKTKFLNDIPKEINLNLEQTIKICKSNDPLERPKIVEILVNFLLSSFPETCFKRNNNPLPFGVLVNKNSGNIISFTVLKEIRKNIPKECFLWTVYTVIIKAIKKKPLTEMQQSLINLNKYGVDEAIKDYKEIITCLEKLFEEEDVDNYIVAYLLKYYIISVPLIIYLIQNQFIDLSNNPIKTKPVLNSDKAVVYEIQGEELVYDFFSKIEDFQDHIELSFSKQNFKIYIYEMSVLEKFASLIYERNKMFYNEKIKQKIDSLKNQNIEFLDKQILNLLSPLEDKTVNFDDADIEKLKSYELELQALPNLERRNIFEFSHIKIFHKHLEIVTNKIFNKIEVVFLKRLKLLKNKFPILDSIFEYTGKVDFFETKIEFINKKIESGIQKSSFIDVMDILESLLTIFDYFDIFEYPFDKVPNLLVTVTSIFEKKFNHLKKQIENQVLKNIETYTYQSSNNIFRISLLDEIKEYCSFLSQLAWEISSKGDKFRNIKKLSVNINYLSNLTQEFLINLECILKREVFLKHKIIFDLVLSIYRQEKFDFVDEFEQKIEKFNKELNIFENYNAWISQIKALYKYIVGPLIKRIDNIIKKDYPLKNEKEIIKNQTYSPKVYKGNEIEDLKKFKLEGLIKFTSLDSRDFQIFELINNLFYDLNTFFREYFEQMNIEMFSLLDEMTNIIGSIESEEVHFESLIILTKEIHLKFSDYKKLKDYEELKLNLPFEREAKKLEKQWISKFLRIWNVLKLKLRFHVVKDKEKINLLLSELDKYFLSD